MTDPSKLSTTTEQTQVPSFTDHIRMQFESLRRQPELLPELACFRPGGELSQIEYFAHPHGLHVARWLKILAHTQSHISIGTANPTPAFRNDLVSAHPLVPRAFLKIPMAIRYVIAGLAARFSRPASPTGLVHAHCASGNGVIAWLSGRKYLIGTYGSEIFDAPRRGFLYRWLMNRILHGAERIADCSPECTKVLREQFGIPAERIYSFHLGYDELRFHTVSHQKRMTFRSNHDLPHDEPIWVINRRSDPHYRTLEVVSGFLEYSRENPRGRLIVLCGDHQAQYVDQICELVARQPEGRRVTIVKEMLSPDEFAAWLQLSDYSISVPKTDNFSIAILESMGCGTVPVVSNLDGYKELRDCPSVCWMDRFEPADFCEMFEATSKAWQRHDRERTECYQFVRERFSTEQALRDIAAFYLGTPMVRNHVQRKAA